MMIVALLIGCFLAKAHAWKAFLLCLIAGIEIVALQPFTNALGGQVRLAEIQSDIVLGTGSLTLLFFAGLCLRRNASAFRLGQLLRRHRHSFFWLAALRLCCFGGFFLGHGTATGTASPQLFLSWRLQ
jgi:hypothetical protein